MRLVDHLLNYFVWEYHSPVWQMRFRGTPERRLDVEVLFDLFFQLFSNGIVTV